MAKVLESLKEHNLIFILTTLVAFSSLAMILGEGGGGGRRFIPNLRFLFHGQSTVAQRAKTTAECLTE